MPARGLVLAVGTVVVLAGCGSGFLPTTGSGELVVTQQEIPGVAAIAVGSSFDVTLRLADEPSVRVTADDNIIDRVRSTLTDGLLTLDLEGSVADATLEAEVTVPADALSSITVSEAASLTAPEPLTTASLDLAVDGAGRAFVVLACESVEVDVDAAGVVNAAGEVASLRVDAAGASAVRLDRLTASTATVDAGGTADVRVRVTEELSASAEGASSIRYSGEPPEVTSSATEASRVEPD